MELAGGRPLTRPTARASWEHSVRKQASIDWTHETPVTVDGVAPGEALLVLAMVLLWPMMVVAQDDVESEKERAVTEAAEKH